MINFLHHCIKRRNKFQFYCQVKHRDLSLLLNQQGGLNPVFFRGQDQFCAAFFRLGGQHLQVFLPVVMMVIKKVFAADRAADRFDTLKKRPRVSNPAKGKDFFVRQFADLDTLGSKRAGLHMAMGSMNNRDTRFGGSNLLFQSPNLLFACLVKPGNHHHIRPPDRANRLPQ